MLQYQFLSRQFRCFVGYAGVKTRPRPDSFSHSATIAVVIRLPAYQRTVHFPTTAIGLSLVTPYAYPLFGTLNIGIASGSFGGNSAVQFFFGRDTGDVQDPGKYAPGGLSERYHAISFQTGTVAGVIQVTPSFTVGSIPAPTSRRQPQHSFADVPSWPRQS